MRRLIATAFAVGCTAMTLTPGLGAVAAEPAAKATTSAVESRIVTLVNKERRKHGCRTVKANSNLHTAALKHTRKMVAADTMSHQLPGEAGLGKRITAAGYAKWRLVGENVAYGYPTARTVMTAWMKSPGHRRNILTCTYRDLGVAVVAAEDGTLWYTQNFGRK